MSKTEVRARRDLDAAREELEAEIRFRRGLFGGLISAIGVVPTGFVLAFQVHGAFVVLAIIAFVVAVVLTVGIALSTSEDVNPARRALRKAQWAYEDIVLNGVQS